MSTIRQLPTICIAENRASAQVGVYLLLASLLAHNEFTEPIRLRIYSPLALDQARINSWLTARSNIEIEHITDLNTSATGWDVKPTVLLHSLEDSPEVFWIDSDIIVNRPLTGLFPNALPADNMLVAEEPKTAQHNSGSRRTSAWGMNIGRELPHSVNSGVLRFTRHHVELLGAWQRLLASPAYRAAQKLPKKQRRMHTLGDQEVLCALVAASPFSSIPLQYLSANSEIVQLHGAAGFTPWARITTAFWQRKPFFVHAMGWKPWEQSSTRSVSGRVFSYYRTLLTETSPYTMISRKYTDMVEGENTEWLTRQSAFGQLLRRLFRNNPFTTSLPLSMIEWPIRRVKRLLRIGRIRI